MGREDALQGLRDLPVKKGFHSDGSIYGSVWNDFTCNGELRLAEVEIFSDIVPDPPTEVVAAGVSHLVESNADAIIQ